MKENKSFELEETVEKNIESKRRDISMIVFSYLFNIIKKISSINSTLKDVRLIIPKPISTQDIMWFRFNFNLFEISFCYFCTDAI